MRILVAECQPLTYLGIQQTLSDLVPVAKTERVQSIRELVKSLARESYAMMILDISMPDANKVSILKMIHQKQPRLPVLINSTCSEHLYALPFLKAGAAGYISKEAPVAEFRTAIETVLKSKVYASEGVLQNAFDSLLSDKKQAESICPLSEKEFEIVKLLCEGNSIKEVSESIHLSSSSVSNYKRGIYKKLKVATIIELKAFFDLYI